MRSGVVAQPDGFRRGEADQTACCKSIRASPWCSASIAAEQITMTPLAGYADRLSVRPGEAIRFHVSNGTGAEVAPPSIVRVISADVNPAGPGIRTVAVDATVRPIAPCQPQSVTPGSYALANLGAALEGLGSLTVIATICPTRIAGEDRPILTAFSKIGRRIRTRSSQRRKCVCVDCRE